MKETELYNEFYEKVNLIWVPMAKDIIKLKKDRTKKLNNQTNRIDYPEDYCQGKYTIHKAWWLLIPLWPFLLMKKYRLQKEYEEEKVTIISDAKKNTQSIMKHTMKKSDL